MFQLIPEKRCLTRSFGVWCLKFPTKKSSYCAYRLVMDISDDLHLQLSIFLLSSETGLD